MSSQKTSTSEKRPSDEARTREDRAGRQSDLPHDFGEWYEEHRPSVYRYVRYRLSNREAAEDVTSTVFVKALRSLDRYDPSLASPRTWLLRIARNAVIDHLRSLKRKGSLHVHLDSVPDLVAHLPSQEERLMKQERIQKLLNATRTLKEADREVLSLRYGAELSNAEIADQLEITPNAVAVRIHRALKRLKEAVEEQHDPGP